jgi:PEP-CTERM motif
MLKALVAASGLMLMVGSQTAMATLVTYTDTTPRDSTDTPITLPLTINPNASLTGVLTWQQDLKADGWTTGANINITSITIDMSFKDNGGSETLNFTFEGTSDGTLTNIPDSGEDWSQTITLSNVIASLQTDGIFNVKVDWTTKDKNSLVFILSGSTLTVTADRPDAVPEPASMALLGAGLIGIGAARRRYQAA